MPPLPKPRTSAAKGSRRPSTGTRERAGATESSSAPPISASRSRTTKADVTKEQLARMYMMVGTMVMPFGRFYPILTPVGENLRNLADDAATAWMELAAKDKRVLEMLESIVGASTWGNVIGIHLAIFASALPMGSYMQQVTNTTESSTGDPMLDEFFRQGRAAGMSDEEIIQAARQAGANVDTGGPGDTVRSQRSPEEAEKVFWNQGRTESTKFEVSQAPSGIVTAEELGATITDQETLFPHDTSPPNGAV